MKAERVKGAPAKPKREQMEAARREGTTAGGRKLIALDVALAILDAPDPEPEPTTYTISGITEEEAEWLMVHFAAPYGERWIISNPGREFAEALRHAARATPSPGTTEDAGST